MDDDRISRSRVGRADAGRIVCGADSKGRRQNVLGAGAMSEECRLFTAAKVDIEKELAAKYGQKLRPVNSNARRPPGIFDFSSTVGNAKMEPKHLTAERLRKLVSEGKTPDDLVHLYNFTKRGTLSRKVLELGCLELLPTKNGKWGW
jgi:hypothetical protein